MEEEEEEDEDEEWRRRALASPRSFFTPPNYQPPLLSMMSLQPLIKRFLDDYGTEYHTKINVGTDQQCIRPHFDHTHRGISKFVLNDFFFVSGFYDMVLRKSKRTITHWTAAPQPRRHRRTPAAISHIRRTAPVTPACTIAAVFCLRRAGQPPLPPPPAARQPPSSDVRRMVAAVFRLSRATRSPLPPSPAAQPLSSSASAARPGRRCLPPQLRGPAAAIFRLRHHFLRPPPPSFIIDDRNRGNRRRRHEL
uniref:Uncharacterized protein n=1 Tax=Oryza sativa subsp. japonica TaxID=39947 RepID=Q69PH4_ORYSJ|nr:hypothetical protein [Oryza sativa Japonica Group]